MEIHSIDGASVPVVDPPKTVVDCFRFRKHAGFDVALEGLHRAGRIGKADPVEIVQNARDTRIRPVARPFLETVVADGA